MYNRRSRIYTPPKSMTRIFSFFIIMYLLLFLNFYFCFSTSLSVMWVKEKDLNLCLARDIKVTDSNVEFPTYYVLKYFEGSSSSNVGVF